MSKYWTSITNESAARALGDGILILGENITSARGQFSRDDELLVMVIETSLGRTLTYRLNSRGFSLNFNQKKAPR